MCDRKRKASQMVRNWQGLYRCPEHNEIRQPQDYVQNVKDIMTTPWGQPPNDTGTIFCTPNGMSAIPGYAVPGCMIPGRTIIVDPGFYPIPPSPEFITTDTGQAITTDTGVLIGTDPLNPEDNTP